MSDYDEIPESSLPRYSPDSAYYKEMRRWDIPKSRGGMRPDGFEMFPRMMYKARRRTNPQGEPYGQLICIDPSDDKFTIANQFTIGNEMEWERAKSQGWRDSPDEALAYAHGLEDDISREAALRQNRDRLMSEKARNEAEEIDAQHFEHLAEIPVQPVRRRGRPKKSTAA